MLTSKHALGHLYQCASDAVLGYRSLRYRSLRYLVLAGYLVLSGGLSSGAAAALEPARVEEGTTPTTLVLGGDVAEIVARLGEADTVIGRDDTVTFPPALARLPSIGYLRRLSGESVLSLHPQRVIASASAGPSEVLAQIEASGVELITLQSQPRLAELDAKVQEIAQALDREAEGDALVAELDADQEQLRSLSPLTGLRIMFMLHHSGMTPMVGGQDTIAQDIIDALGATNAFATLQGYKSVSAEGLISAAPDVVILSHDGLDALGGNEALWQLPGLAMTPAGQSHHFVAVDEVALMGMGPRTPRALIKLHHALSPLARNVSTENMQAAP